MTGIAHQLISFNADNNNERWVLASSRIREQQQTRVPGADQWNSDPRANILAWPTS
jgi:hypothetical protein